MQQSVRPMEFVCDVEPRRERVIVRLAGEFDLESADEVGTTIGHLLDSGFPHVLVDLRDLSFLDSAGLHTLLDARRSAEQRNCRLTLIRGCREVHRVFELTATDVLFVFDGDGAHR
jgi:anti-anti-sigma factor